MERKKKQKLKNKENRPLYHKIYADMIRDKYPDREANCINYLNKRNWTALDVIRVNMILFSNKQGRKEILLGQRHRAYDQKSIKQNPCQLLAWVLLGERMRLWTRPARQRAAGMRCAGGQKKACSHMAAGFEDDGAASRNRTGTVSLPEDFKSSASTSSAMAACIVVIIADRTRPVKQAGRRKLRLFFKHMLIRII